MNEKERCPNQLNVHSQSRYHYLEEPIACEAKDIVSVRLMNWRSYFNSFRIRGSHSTDIWPQKLEHIKGPHLPENQAGKAKASAPIAGSSTGSFSFDFFKKIQHLIFKENNSEENTFSQK